MKSPTVREISECFIKPQYGSEESKPPCYLTSWDLTMLSVNYIQKGLLFAKPPEAQHNENFMADLLERLKESLSLALLHFYPLAGRLATLNSENPASYWIFVDCNNSPGARFIYAAALDITVNDILSPVDVPLVVQSFFDHHKAVNHDGHTLSLLSIQVTELLDGVFIGCSMNHAVGDGTSYWNFLNMWSEIFQKQRNSVNSISRPPVVERWFPPGHGPIINLPFTHHDQFIGRFESPQLRERMFHFTAESVAKLKAKANAECNTNKISSFQALTAFVWRSITRVRRLQPNQTTICWFAIDCRSRINPPLSRDYFGNSVSKIKGVATASDLVEQGLGWAAWQLNQAVVGFNEKVVNEGLNSWLQSPAIYQTDKTFDPFCVLMGSSPRFNKYGNEFGMGKPLAIRSGYSNKFNGKVTTYPGREGGGSIDLEVCLPPLLMSALESDKEFLEAAASSSSTNQFDSFI